MVNCRTRVISKGGDERAGDVTRNSSNVQFTVDIQAVGEAKWNSSD